METQAFSQLLLKTAFSCMACDGDIDKREVQLIKKMHVEQGIFGSVELDNELEDLFVQINRDGRGFLTGFFQELDVADLNQSEEVKLLEVAMLTINADERVEYSEIKFFKVIRSRLNVDNDAILAVHPDFEGFLEEDIFSESYLRRLTDDFFDTHFAGELKMTQNTNEDFLTQQDLEENEQ